MTSEVLCALGVHGGRTEYLYDFSWDCDWYWGGGYVGNKHSHHHFENLSGKYNISMYDSFKHYYDSTKLTDEQLWRLCDLMIQFYAHTESAECFQWGGHCINGGRTHEEINSELATALNVHIETVIIAEVRKLLKDVDKQVSVKI